MELSKLKEYENKLLAIIETLKFDEEFLPPAVKEIGYTALEEVLGDTANTKILRFAANEYINKVNTDNNLAEEIAKNKHTPDTILNKLAQVDGCGYIAYGVANNTSTSTVTLLWMHKYCDSVDIHKYTETQLNQRRVVLEDNGNIQEF